MIKKILAKLKFGSCKAATPNDVNASNEHEEKKKDGTQPNEV